MISRWGPVNFLYRYDGPFRFWAFDFLKGFWPLAGLSPHEAASAQFAVLVWSRQGLINFQTVTFLHFQKVFLTGFDRFRQESVCCGRLVSGAAAADEPQFTVLPRMLTRILTYSISLLGNSNSNQKI